MRMENAAKNIRIYKASAGSGKTYRLAYEYVSLLFRNRAEAHPHRGTLAVTFTNKATDEMKRRIVKELYALATRDDAPFLHELEREPDLNGLSRSDIRTLAQRFLTDILHDYSGFNVSTIDRFFQQIVRAFTREIGLHGNYGVELDVDNLLQQAIDNMLFELDKAENRPLLDWLRQLVEERIANDKGWRIESELERLGGEIFKESYQQHAQLLDERLHDRQLLADYRKRLAEIVATFEGQMRANCQAATAIMRRHGLAWSDFSGGSRSFAHYFDYKYLKIKKFDVPATFRKAVGENDKWSTKKSPLRTEIEAAYNAGLNDLAAKIVAMIDGEACCRYFSAKAVLENISLLGVLGDISAQIQRYCTEKNTMLISDTTDFLHKIIADCDTPFVYEKAGVFLHHFMMDEFQDTSLLQWENFRPLLKNSVAENRRNLIVGDVKQSIYRWRNSDWRLLQSQVKRDFGEQQVEELPLDTNWRSARRVVQFNNALFARVPQMLQAFLGDRATLVQQLYDGVAQQIKSRADGYVQMRFITDKSDDETKWRERAMQQLPSIIDQLKANGYRLSQMTVLVRRNVEAAQVADFLLKAGYEVVSNEALLIASAPCVRLLTGMMRFFVEPANRINRLLVESIYTAQGGRPTVVAATDETAEAWLARLFGDDADAINRLKNKPLFQLVEAMIQLFALTEREGNRVFLQAFQDEIFAYTANREADINGFLDYWDEVSDKRFLAASETQNAIRIMTVHKSKGLEFEAVIVPFCEWKFEESSNNKKILWCQPAADQQPFAQMPVVPVCYKKELSRTIFADAYADEQMYNCIDVLNTAYVAFTRPRNCLYIVAPQKKNEQNEIKSIANLLEQCFGGESLPDELAEFVQKSENEDVTTIEIGQCAPLDSVAQTSEIVADSLPLTYDTVSTENRLRLRYTPDDEGSERRYGLLMHGILGRLVRADDLDKTLLQCVADGEIAADEEATVRAEMLKLLSNRQAREWFSGKYEVRNETEIIASSGKIYRPDRVMTNGQNVVVVDYKFGTQKQSRYRAQVANYMRLIESMGYRSEGYIWYAMLDEIEKI